MISRRKFLGRVALAAAFGSMPFRRALALEAGQPSRTALGAARYRALHQLTENPQVFDDPLALRILGAQAEIQLRSDAAHGLIDGSSALRAFIAMRSRYAEDRLAAAYARGVRQYVVLGAGLDTFAYRNRFSGLQVFEVDYPATQAWKRERLQQAGIAIPESLVFTPVDFEKQTLADGLRAAGLRAGQPAFLSMLGVTIYLTHGATMGTMRFAASLPAGSEIVFDFSPPPESLGDAERASHQRSAAQVAAIGEPWIGYFEPDGLARELRALGFRRATVLGSDEANGRYFDNRRDGFRLYGSGRMMAAEV